MQVLDYLCHHFLQLFWEAFPADGGSARTTYMFAYSDAHPDRPTFERLLDAYFALLPAYQGLGPDGLDGLKFKRVLFGGFPCYADSPLKPGKFQCTMGACGV
jgi:lycopene cyclase CruP